MFRGTGRRISGDPDGDASVPLVVNGVSKRYGRFEAVRDVTLEVRSSGIHALVGPNGAGKSTLFNVISGSLPASAGTVSFFGRTATSSPPHVRVRLGVGRSFQISSLFPELSVFENVRLAVQGAQAGMPWRFWRDVRQWDDLNRAAMTLIERVRLVGLENALAGDIGHGQQRLLELGMALAAGDRLLLLDEPTSGMGREEVPLVEGVLTDIATTHSVLLIEHNMGLVLNLAKHIFVMVEGRLIASGPPDEIRENEAVRRAYLGMRR